MRVFPLETMLRRYSAQLEAVEVVVSGIMYVIKGTIASFTFLIFIMYIHASTSIHSEK